jgi:uncharacterized phosphosugar-binding protein
MDNSVTREYLDKVEAHLELIQKEESEHILSAAKLFADKIKKDEIIYVYGPGGHSNLASQEIFFRAGGLFNVSAILDEGTLISGGALRSMAIERMPGYSDIVLEDYGIKKGDLLVLVNAYGINAAVVGAALEAKRRGATVIAVTSIRHAKGTPMDHPARHPSKKNLYEVADLVVDSKVEVGDATLRVPGLNQPICAMSTFANAFVLNSIVAQTVKMLVAEGITPPLWASGNQEGGDDLNARYIEHFKGRIKLL